MERTRWTRWTRGNHCSRIWVGYRVVILWRGGLLHNVFLCLPMPCPCPCLLRFCGLSAVSGDRNTTRLAVSGKTTRENVWGAHVALHCWC